MSRSRKLAVFLDKVADSAATHSLDGTIIPVGAEHMNALLRMVEKFIYDALLGRVSLELKGIGVVGCVECQTGGERLQTTNFQRLPARANDKRGRVSIVASATSRRNQR